MFLWAAGCTTLFSCQGDQWGDMCLWAHVIFVDGWSFDKALQAIWCLVRDGDTPLRSRVAHIGLTNERPPLAWRHDLFVQTVPPYDSSERLSVCHILRFTPLDMAEVTALIAEEAAGLQGATARGVQY